MNRIRILAPIIYLLIALVAGQIPGVAHAERIRDLGQTRAHLPAQRRAAGFVRVGQLQSHELHLT